MFKFKRAKQKNINAANARLVKKVLRKDSGRRVFGFPCSPDIPARLKLLAGQLNIPNYALCEHALQLSTELIAKMAENSEESALLKKHITEIHVNARTLEKISAYDQDMAERLDEERLRRLEIDRAAHQIVINFIRRGLKPREIPWIIDYGMRCRIAVAQGKPIPTDWPTET
jgi:hypothetical protein